MADAHQPSNPQSKGDPDRHSTEIHHLYFEDNDSFFPPSWLGKDGPRRPSTESTDTDTSQGVDSTERDSGRSEQSW
ncbi:uncharacterized protein N7506_012182 [Penicillium brevicompactum]|uniref:Uncharacterized protein n=1 Tax=Penicillium brevicompactum TaxID=5074 RepID=A0A9W9U7H1_PENBR|nr:uncharacterized protein N7506_012182 [Penicillium brevicompactum]KAJ5319478.1 hypothetical protein N7506_012182 [Penicillium brevicompactum]KAJ5323057.1 hypothetical protein N7452_011346 [Penicillium brevicompactum]